MSHTCIVNIHTDTIGFCAWFRTDKLMFANTVCHWSHWGSRMCVSFCHQGEITDHSKSIRCQNAFAPLFSNHWESAVVSETGLQTWRKGEIPRNQAYKNILSLKSGHIASWHLALSQTPVPTSVWAGMMSAKLIYNNLVYFSIFFKNKKRCLSLFHRFIVVWLSHYYFLRFQNSV